MTKESVLGIIGGAIGVGGIIMGLVFQAQHKPYIAHSAPTQSITGSIAQSIPTKITVQIERKDGFTDLAEKLNIK